MLLLLLLLLLVCGRAEQTWTGKADGLSWAALVRRRGSGTEIGSSGGWLGWAGRLYGCRAGEPADDDNVEDNGSNDADNSGERMAGVAAAAATLFGHRKMSTPTPSQARHAHSTAVGLRTR